MYNNTAKTEDNILVVTLDFDLTVAGINKDLHHIHNIIQEAINKHNVPFQKKYDEELDSERRAAISKEATDTNPYLKLENQWELIKDIPVRGPKNAWRDIILQMIEKGIYIVFASFNNFEPIMKKYLIEVVGLPEKTVNEKIIFVAKNPPPPKETDNPATYYGLVKVSYIKQGVEIISEKIGRPISNQETGFVDDSVQNYDAAKAAGFQAIHAALGSDKFFKEMNKKFKLTPVEHSKDDEDDVSAEPYDSEEDSSDLYSSTNSDYSCSGSQEIQAAIEKSSNEKQPLGGSADDTIEALNERFKQREKASNANNQQLLGGSADDTVEALNKRFEEKKNKNSDAASNQEGQKQMPSSTIMAFYHQPSTDPFFQPTPATQNTSNIHLTMAFTAKKKPDTETKNITGGPIEIKPTVHK